MELAYVQSRLYLFSLKTVHTHTHTAHTQTEMLERVTSLCLSLPLSVF